jgi:putative tricarboxylic transport membrane protein
MELLIQGFQIVLQPMALLFILIGTCLGVVFGALPGVSSSMAVVLCISFTYSMSPLAAIAFLVTVYCSAVREGASRHPLGSGTPAAPRHFRRLSMTLRGEPEKRWDLA